mmetsp:Transcript_19251/g.38295  ORF Transcript_19251/g.38295 Transcript_19251/m.38295 type:complete len:210 (+) Transcript_19251:552-1181(+)
MDGFLTEFLAYEDFSTERASELSSTWVPRTYTIEMVADKEYLAGRRYLSSPKNLDVFITEWDIYSDFLYRRNFPDEDKSYKEEESTDLTAPPAAAQTELTTPPKDSTALPQEDPSPPELASVKGLLSDKIVEKEAKSPLLADNFSRLKEANSPSLEKYFAREIHNSQQKVDDIFFEEEEEEEKFCDDDRDLGDSRQKFCDDNGEFDDGV